ncbi:MAG: DNA polymerase III subunit gamma/tau [Lachnospiraceae bacterium]|nr:DNA polymerase III subunit gamma/tau [Lachnospiraceae bacterium]
MAYTALYRKWRPTRFEEVVGQEGIVRALKNQIRSGRIGHAYLFCGTRGTGKTTMAKIFARAVNCEHPVDGGPCNECEVCRSILSGNSVNVVEIDAASNNGVDNIREIREEVRYKPTEGKYRVYIIDEVHMLSPGAFNALLKTLEEPPEYVIFILATTEVHKIPVTVLSRCQRYDFKRLSLEQLEGQLRDLMRAENVQAEDGAVRYIARVADGSSRDALSLLEQCISFCYGETLTYEKVLDVLGAVDQQVFSDLLKAVLDYDVAGAVNLIDGVMAAGRDIGQFVTDFIWYLRNILMIQTEDPDEEVLGISRENLLRMKEEARGTEIGQIMRYIRILSALSNEMRYAAAKRVLLEIAIMRMMQPEMEEDPDSLLDRIRVLEDKLRNGVPAGSRAQEVREIAEDVEHASGGQETPEEARRTVEVSDADYADYQLLSENWKDFVDGLEPMVASVFVGTKIGAKPDILQILFSNGFKLNVAKTTLEAELRNKLEKRFGKKFHIELALLKKDEALPKVVPGRRIPGIEMDIEED